MHKTNRTFVFVTGPGGIGLINARRRLELLYKDRYHLDMKRFQEGAAAIRASDISRTHRERLVKHGFLQEVMKGWYIPTRPDEQPGDSTSWYASFWRFCAVYLEEHFGKEWSLSPEQSLLLHSGNWAVPRQLLVRSPKARYKVTPLAKGRELRSDHFLKKKCSLVTKAIRIHFFGKLFKTMLFNFPL